MKILHKRWIISLMSAAILFGGFSCAHRNAEKQDVTITPAEDENIMTEYKKGIEDSKKIVVARVNGVGITLNDLIDRMNRFASDYIPESHQQTPEIDQAVKQEALDILLFRELAVQEAVRQGMTVPPEIVERFIQDLKDRTGSEDGYHEYLQKINYTEESLKKEFERNQLFDMIAEKEIYSKAMPDGDEGRSVANRKEEWYAELKNNATIEILLEEVEKKMREDSEKRKKE